MILLDTNVVSEMMRAIPDPRVVAWLDAQVVETLHLSTVSLAELLLGVAVLPDGKRKAQLQGSLDGALQALFGERLLTFDAAAAQAYARLISRARTIGRHDRGDRRSSSARRCEPRRCPVRGRRTDRDQPLVSRPELNIARRQAARRACLA